MSTTLTYEEYRGNKSKVGEYYGYPKCCISQFMEICGNRNKNDKYAINYKAGSGGFIPCTNHAHQLLNKEIKIKDLIINRKCKTQFPRDNDDLLQKYRARLIS